MCAFFEMIFRFSSVNYYICRNFHETVKSLTGSHCEHSVQKKTQCDMNSVNGISLDVAIATVTIKRVYSGIKLFQLIFPACAVFICSKETACLNSPETQAISHVTNIIWELNGACNHDSLTHKNHYNPFNKNILLTASMVFLVALHSPFYNDDVDKSIRIASV